jgi:hypothetical protein
MLLAVTDPTVAGFAPNRTVAPAMKLNPPIVTLVPPVVGPELGDTRKIVGDEL